MSALRPRRDQLSFGGSIGQVGRFTALYGGAYSLLYQVTNAFSMASKEVINYTNALEDLAQVSTANDQQTKALATSLGSLAVTATASSDIPVIQGVAVYFTLIVISINLLLDLVVGWINPQVST